MGQWASSRADLFPPIVCTLLVKLQSNVGPHAFHHTQRAIQDAFLYTIDELFDSFDPDPIGCGAIAQVHRATIKEARCLPSTIDSRPNREVAVKVLHPGARLMIQTDLIIMNAMAKLLDVLIPGAQWLSFPDEARIFGEMMQSQLDLQREARHLLTFKKNFETWQGIDFPTPLHGFMASDVVIESFVHAVPMSKFLQLGSGGFDKELGRLGLTSFLKMLILDNFVHSDLHPGNIMVTFHHPSSSYINPIDKDHLDLIDNSVIKELRETTDAARWNELLDQIQDEGYDPFMYMVDAGLTSSLSAPKLQNFLDLFKAITEFDGREISYLMISRSNTPWTVKDAQGFQQSMSQFITRIKKETFAFQNIEVADILKFVLEQVRKHHVKIDGDFVNVAISIMLLEGMGRRLEPSMDLLHASIPFLRKAMSSQQASSSLWQLTWKALFDRS